jgi:hypothetical protein
MHQPTNCMVFTRAHGLRGLHGSIHEAAALQAQHYHVPVLAGQKCGGCTGTPPWPTSLRLSPASCHQPNAVDTQTATSSINEERERAMRTMEYAGT